MDTMGSTLEFLPSQRPSQGPSLLRYGVNFHLSILLRVLLAKPRLVLMDESTSALDTDNEAHLFRCLQESGIQYVSIGHRPTLSEFHSKVLRLTLSQHASDGGAASADEPKCRWEIHQVGRETEVKQA